MMTKTALRFFHDRAGATAIEYGLIASIICASLILGLGTFANKLEDVLTLLANTITAGGT